MKKPRLFYYEEAVCGFIPVPEFVEHITEVDNFLSDGDEETITFKRIDMTDEEFDNLPED